jgi:hypothetical protein
MSAPKLKCDIKPLCDKHLVEMEAVRVKAKMGGSDEWTWDPFRCPVQGCTRSFDSGGYITVSNGMIDPASRNFIGCEEGAMFVESVQEDRLIWRCCIDGCERSRATDRAFLPEL